MYRITVMKRRALLISTAPGLCLKIPNNKKMGIKKSTIEITVNIIVDQ